MKLNKYNLLGIVLLGVLLLTSTSSLVTATDDDGDGIDDDIEEQHKREGRSFRRPEKHAVPHIVWFRLERRTTLPSA